MKICPVCNDSFADELNFCDIDGVRLTQEGVAQERNKWWSLAGAALLLLAVAISAMTIFLPRARVATPVVSSEPQQAPVPPRTAAPENAPAVAAASVEPGPEKGTNDTSALEPKKKDKVPANVNPGVTAPNPKAAAIASETADKAPGNTELKNGEPAALRNPETPPAVRSPREIRVSEPPKPLPPPDMRGDHQPQPPSSKNNDKAAADKKKSDDKDKKKGGFLKVFKKIFGKD